VEYQVVYALFIQDCAGNGVALVGKRDLKQCMKCCSTSLCNNYRCMAQTTPGPTTG